MGLHRPESLATDLHIPIRADQEKASARHLASEVEEQIQRATVGPVEVLQHDEQGLYRAGVAQKAGHSLEEPPALLVGVRSDRSRCRVRQL